ncbi:collagen alpha-2(I) chain-like isoform X2 [Trematomus bernacchii]|uniref:collagen alpha-2(I) chain-like isoform X2 n=1 Tax=Trematomus bernacchii TaxID=40690 RepID=UPI00146CC88E|nr:collagen alpha-2(I) chain-like isoform X2 [Trematomus bernacchii]
MELITSVRVLWICLLLVGSGEGFPATKGGSEAPNEDPQSYKPDKFIMPSDSNQGSVNLTAPPTEAGDQPPSREDTDLGVSSSSLVHSVSPAWNNPPMLDFGDGPVPYIGGPEAYHFGPGSFPFGTIESVQKGIAESTAAATGGRVDGPVPYDGANQYSNVGYPVTNEGQTGLYDGPVPNGAATRYANAKPVSKDFSPRGRVDGPVPYDDDTRYANAAPINAGQTGSNPAAPGGLDDRPDPNGGAKPVSINVAPSGLVDGPVPFGSDTQDPNAGYPVTNKGQTGRSTANGPVPYGSSSQYTNADPTKDGQSGNPGSVPSGAAPEVISYGYGGYPLGNMDVADRNTAASGRVDGPVPFGGDTRYANAAPINAGQTGSNPASLGGLDDRPDPNGGAKPVSINVAPSGLVDGPVPFGGDTQDPNAGYPVTNKGQTGRSTANGPVPYGSASQYTNADPTKDSQSGNPGSVPSGAAPEVISYGYGGYPLGNMDESNTTASERVDGPVSYGGATRHTNANPVKKDSQSGNLGSIPSGVAPEVISDGYVFYPFGNMDVADRNTAASGRVDGPVPFGGDTHYANAAPINAGQTGSNPAAPGGLDDRPDPNGGAKPVSINVAPSGLVDGPVPFGGDTRYPNAGYPVTNKGQTGRSTADGPVPYGSASHYTNADPTKDGQSGNPGSVPSGAAPEVISYGYGGYPLGNMDESNTTASERVDGPVSYGGATRHTNANPVKKDSQSGNLGSIPSGVAPEVISDGYVFYPFGNMDVADRNTAASGRVDGPVPFGGDTRYANAAPINAGQTGSNPASLGGLDDRPDPNGGAKPVSINVAPSGLVDGPVPFGGDAQDPNAGYPVTNKGQTGRSTANGPVPYGSASQYTNADPTKDGQSGNPGSVPSGAAPEVISYGYGGYPLGNMDESNTTASGRVDGPVPYGGATRHTNANPVKKDSQSGNLGSIPSGVAPEVISDGYVFYPFGNMDVADRNTAASGRVDGPVPFGGDTRYANAAPINAGQTGSNPAAPGGLDDRPDPNGGAKPVSLNVAPSGLVNGPVPFGGDTQDPNAGYPVTNKGQTGRSTADGPVPYGSASHYTNADPTKDSQSGNLGSIPSGVAPEVISYGYGFYPFGNVDVADRNTPASGRVDGPVPFGDTRYANAAPINAGQTGSNPAAPGGLDDGPDPYGGAKPVSINVAPSGRVDGPVPFDATQYVKTGYAITNEGQTGLYDGPVPYDGATRYANAKPVSKDSQSGNPGSVPSGVAPEVVSYGYGGYPFANMDVVPRGRVDGLFPFGGNTRYANAAPINGGQTRSNRGGLYDGTVPLGGAPHYSNVGYPVTNKDQTSINTADGPVSYEPTDPVVFPWAKTSFMKPNNWRPPFWGFAQWEPITETPVSDKSPPLSSSYIVQSRNSYQREKEVLSHSSFSPESEVFEAPRRRKTPGGLSIAGTNVF